MASFPTAAVTFTQRANGQVIDQAWFNTPGDELAAVLDGYLNGTARLNSSNSTLANLSVAGGSTFTGSVTFSSAITVSTKVIPGSTATMIGDSTTGFKEVHCSSLYVGGQAVAVTAAPVMVKVAHSGNSSYGTLFTGLNWDTEEYDSTGMHSTSANSSRLTFVASTGVYHVGAAITSTQVIDSTEALQVAIILNDSTTFLASDERRVGQRGFNTFTLSADVRIASTTDYVTVVARRLGVAASTGGTILGNSTHGPTAFWAHRIST